jgi:hypothetical protein
VYSSASLVLEKDANGSYANGKVVVSTENGASGAPLPEISVAEVYRSGVNSVTINSATPSSYAWGATGPNRYYTEIVFTVILTNGIKRTYTIPVTHTLS